MIITKTCNTCEHYPNDKHCIGCEWDKANGINTKWELKENPIVIERKVLDKIRAEIDDIEEGISSYHNDRPWVFKDEVLQIIDKYKGDKK